MSYKDKYLKYKQKYLNLKNQNAGSLTNEVIKHLTETIKDWLDPSSDKVGITLSTIFNINSLESDNFIHTLLSRANEFDKDIIESSYRYLLDNNKIFNIMNLDNDESINLITILYPDIIDLLKPSSSSEKNPCRKLIHSMNIYKNSISIYEITAYMLVIRRHCNSKKLYKYNYNYQKYLDTHLNPSVINSLINICYLIKNHANKYYLFAFINIILDQLPDIRDYLQYTKKTNENDEKLRLTIIDLINCLANELDKNELSGDFIFKEYFQTNIYISVDERIVAIEPRLIKYLTNDQRHELLCDYPHELWVIGESNPEQIAKIAEYLYNMKSYDDIKGLYKYNMDKLPKHMKL
jgi:hypothetical protein